MTTLNTASDFGEFARDNNYRAARIMAWLILVINPVFAVLDRFLFSDNLEHFLALRVFLEATGIAVLVLLARAPTFSRRHAAGFPIFMCLVLALSIEAMVFLDTGYGSPYYAGINLAPMATAFLALLSPAAGAGLCLAVAGAFVAPAILGLASVPDAIIFMTHLSFLASTLLIIFVAIRYRWRFEARSFADRAELRTATSSLERALDELKELDRVKMRFFANVSHELRTPLTLILAPLEILTKQRHDTHTAGLVRAMSANALRLLRQVNMILDVAKVEAGRLRTQLEPGSLGAVLEGLVEAASPHAESRGIRLETQGLDKLPDSNFDGEKMETVAANLLSNALKFTRPGGCVTVRAVETAPDRLGFEVADDGLGIPADELEKIFHTFHQVDSSASREQEGTGLGLVLTRELARLHHGDVTVRSELGKGSSFRVELPIDPPVEEDRRRGFRRASDRFSAARLDVITADYQPTLRATKTLFADVRSPDGAVPDEVLESAGADAPLVLVVEDNNELRNFEAAELSQRYRVIAAGDGREGLRAAQRFRPAIIVSDIMMPKMNGYELLKEVRADPLLSTVPVILVSARAETEEVVEGLEGGADDYLTKPFDIRELSARVAAHLRVAAQKRTLDERESRLAALGQMARTIVHDLRNPLAVIASMGELIVGEQPDEGLRTDVGIIIDASGRVQHMLRDILDFASGSNVRLAMAPTRCRDFLVTLLEPLALHLRAFDITLISSLQLAPDRMATLDTGRISRAIENVVSNAIEAIGTGGSGRTRAVYVHATETATALQLRIADTGPGISPDMVDRLFEVDATDKAGGSGLGLATARSLVRAHGGDIEAEATSDVGGAAFTISLPWDGPRAPPASPEGAGGATPALTPPGE